MQCAFGSGVAGDVEFSIVIERQNFNSFGFRVDQPVFRDSMLLVEVPFLYAVAVSGSDGDDLDREVDWSVDDIPGTSEMVS